MSIEQATIIDTVKDEPDSAVVGGNSAVLEPAWLQDLPNYSVFEVHKFYVQST